MDIYIYIYNINVIYFIFQNSPLIYISISVDRRSYQGRVVEYQKLLIVLEFTHRRGGKNIPPFRAQNFELATVSNTNPSEGGLL